MLPMTIYKYDLDFDADMAAHFKAPPGKLLKVALQNGRTYAWIMHDGSEELIEWDFCGIMTGEQVPDPRWKYIDTIFKDWVVVHIFRFVDESY